MGIKKVLLSLGLCTFVSVSGMAMANAKAAPENDDRAQQECPEGEKCDRPAPDQKKLKKGEERREEAAPEGKAPRKAKGDGDRAAPEGDGKAPPKAMKARAENDDRDAARDEQKPPKDAKKKPPKPADDEDQDQ